jgi:uncharacterized protein YbjT (DUF2867 family)
VARVLIVGCGCRGRALARFLLADGHAVRATSRDPGRLERAAALGAEPYRGDPDRIGSLLYAFDGATVVCWLLASATGDPERVNALHGGRLEMLLAKLVDTTVRGVLYEAGGSVAPAALARGRAIAERAKETWEIPIAFLEADPGDPEAWTAAARQQLEGLLAASRSAPL